MLKVKAIEKLQKIGKYEGTHRYVMQPEMYAQLAQDKVIKEAADRIDEAARAEWSSLRFCRVAPSEDEVNW